MTARQSRSKTQVRKDRSALKKLQSTGLLSGRVDLRKKPTKYQQSLLRKYADVITGKATVVKPKDPASYKGLFKTKGAAVIVPRRKGEKISVDKKGAIVGTRKVGNRTVKSKFQNVKPHEPIARPASKTQYAIPFVRAGGEVQWMRFPDYDQLKKFMEGYDYKGWRNYVVSERIGEDDDEDDETLNEKLESKLDKLRARRDRQLKKEVAKRGTPRVPKTAKRTGKPAPKKKAKPAPAKKSKGRAR